MRSTYSAPKMGIAETFLPFFFQTISWKGAWPTMPKTIPYPLEIWEQDFSRDTEHIECSKIDIAQTFLPTPDDWKIVTEWTVILISRMVCRNPSRFKPLAKYVVWCVQNPYSEQSSKKSEIMNTSFDIILKGIFATCFVQNDEHCFFVFFYIMKLFKHLCFYHNVALISI